MPFTSGLLNVNKPAGMTFPRGGRPGPALARPTTATRERVPRRCPKVGHAGTLDPLATGVLIVCVGQGTRLIQYVQRMPKRYIGTFLLGRRSPTEDTDGDVALLAAPPVPAREQLEAAASRFVGRLMPAAAGLFRAEGGGAAGLRPCASRRSRGFAAAAD